MVSHWLRQINPGVLANKACQLVGTVSCRCAKRVLLIMYVLRSARSPETDFSQLISSRAYNEPFH